MTLRTKNEFIPITLLGVVLLALIAAGVEGLPAVLPMLRLLLGLFFVLFVPGYALQAAMFPRSEDPSTGSGRSPSTSSGQSLDGPERLALSFGLSVAVIAPMVLVLDWLPWGIRLWPIVVGEGLVIVICSAIALWRRRRLPEPERPEPPPQIGRGVITARVLNVRAQPGASPDNRPVDRLRSGAEVDTFEEREVAGALWYRIGEDRWVHGGWVHRIAEPSPEPPPEPPPGVIGRGVVVGSALDVRARPRARPDNPPVLTFEVDVRGWWAAQDRTGRILYGILGFAFTLALVSALAITFLPKPGDHFTEFYILGPEGVAESYPRETVAGQPVTVTVGITNREGVEAEYRVEVRNSDHLIGQAEPGTLETGATDERPVTFAPAEVGDDIKIEFLLYRDGGEEPYRSLRLWMKVGERPPTTDR